MVCFNQRGSGLLDNIMKQFSFEKYKNERYAISLASDTFGKPMNFMGPHTDLGQRLNPDETPKTSSDSSDY